MIFVEVRKAGMTVLRMQLCTLVEMGCEGTYRQRCADLARKLENYKLERPYDLIVTGEEQVNFGAVRPLLKLFETVYPEIEEELDDQPDGHKGREI